MQLIIVIILLAAKTIRCRICINKQCFDYGINLEYNVDLEMNKQCIDYWINLELNSVCIEDKSTD